MKGGEGEVYIDTTTAETMVLNGYSKWPILLLFKGKFKDS